jgi:N6-adenosine-specific RNA methylase IME4
MTSPFAGLPKHHFATMLVDAPYHFGTYSKKGQGRSPSQHYSDMTIDELAKLPVADLAAPDCWLFNWIPDPHIEAGLALMKAWGFSISGKAHTWAKQNPSGTGWHFGMGFTTRKNTESCWLGRRGKPKILAHDVRELIIAPRREHSRKPDEIYGGIERMCAGPYLEMFARQQWPGWSAWGDQVDRFETEDTAS